MSTKGQRPRSVDKTKCWTACLRNVTVERSAEMLDGNFRGGVQRIRHARHPCRVTLHHRHACVSEKVVWDMVLDQALLGNPKQAQGSLHSRLTHSMAVCGTDEATSDLLAGQIATDRRGTSWTKIKSRRARAIPAFDC